MTIEEIRRNAPEGARFYRVDEGIIDYFYMTCSQSGYKWSEQANEWIRCFWFGTNPMDKLESL